MRLKHNKKRNTAFLYEALIKELTKTIIHKEESKKEKIVLMIRESFNPKTLLGQELLLYNVYRREANCRDPPCLL